MDLIGDSFALQLRQTAMATRRLLASLPAIVLAIACTAAFPQTPNQDPAGDHSEKGCTLRIHVNGLRNSNGNLGSVIFTSADGWPEDTKRAFRAGPTPIPPGKRQTTAVWANLPPGDYGVAAIHDENSNAKLDRNIFGIPKEGFGFANNPHVWFGPPAFRMAIVHVQCPATETTIHLQYR